MQNATETEQQDRSQNWQCMEYSAYLSHNTTNHTKFINNSNMYRKTRNIYLVAVLVVLQLVSAADASNWQQRFLRSSSRELQEVEVEVEVEVEDNSTIVEFTPEDIGYVDPDPKNIIYPSVRYLTWSELENKDAALALGYNEELWDIPGAHIVERVPWVNLNATQLAAAISLGFSRLTWDCNQVHFFYMDWEQLVDYGMHVYWAMLGWTEESWKGEIKAPRTGRKRWGRLTDEQQAGARAVCYHEGSWDQVNLTYWRENYERSGVIYENLPEINVYGPKSDPETPEIEVADAVEPQPMTKLTGKFAPNGENEDIAAPATTESSSLGGWGRRQLGAFPSSKSD